MSYSHQINTKFLVQFLIFIESHYIKNVLIKLKVLLTITKCQNKLNTVYIHIFVVLQQNSQNYYKYILILLLSVHAVSYTHLSKTNEYIQKNKKELNMINQCGQLFKFCPYFKNIHQLIQNIHRKTKQLGNVGLAGYSQVQGQITEKLQFVRNK